MVKKVLRRQPIQPRAIRYTPVSQAFVPPIQSQPIAHDETTTTSGIAPAFSSHQPIPFGVDLSELGVAPTIEHLASPATSSPVSHPAVSTAESGVVIMLLILTRNLKRAVAFFLDAGQLCVPAPNNPLLRNPPPKVNWLGYLTSVPKLLALFIF